MSLGAPLPPRNWSRGPHSGKQETLMVSERATHWLALFKSEEEDRERGMERDDFNGFGG